MFFQEAMKTTDNVLTYGSAALGFGSSLLAQIAAPAVEAVGDAVTKSSPGIETLGLAGASIGLAVLSVRVGGECFRAWVAYREACLHAGELRGRIAELEADAIKAKKLAERGVCPLSDDGSPVCAMNQHHATPNPTPPAGPSSN